MIMKNIAVLLLSSIVTAVLCGTIFLKSTLFMDAYFTPKEICGEAGVALLLLFYTLFFIAKKERRKDGVVKYIVLCIATVVAIEAIYGIIDFISNYISSKQIVSARGNFDNPAGFSALLSSVYPYFLYLQRIAKGKTRLCINILIAIIITAVLLSASRTGILCIVTISLFYLIYRKGISFAKITIISTPFIALLFYVLYNINPNSADGRLFIWARSLEIIKQKPLLGYGDNGFKAQYMKSQADFFEKNPDSPYTMIADNVQFCYNEFINIAIDYGVIGLLFLLISIVFVVLCYKKNHNVMKIYAAMSCISIALFSFFSYPSLYSCVWIITCISVLIIVHPLLHDTISFLEKFRIRHVVTACSILYSIYLLHNATIHMNREMEWKTAHYSYIKTKSKESVNEYRCLYDKMKTNPYFLYNYASVLYNEREYDTSSIIAEQSSRLWKNYNTEILSGAIEEQRKDNNKALMHYTRASNMCPAKFAPLVHIQQIYSRLGDTSPAIEYASKIIKKQEKIKSPRTRQIKELMQFELQKFSATKEQIGSLSIKMLF